MDTDSSVMETIMLEIDIIKEEQMKISNYIAFLEDRRLRMVDFIQKAENLQVSGKGREKLINCVPKLEMRFNSDQVLKENLEIKSKKVCRYHIKGYCKYQTKCRFYRSGQICELFLKDGNWINS